MPGCNQHPCSDKHRELRKVTINVYSGSSQDGRIFALSIKNFSCPSVVYICPERSHHPAVSSNGECHRGELGHLPQERHQAIVVDLEDTEKKSKYMLRVSRVSTQSFFQLTFLALIPRFHCWSFTTPWAACLDIHFLSCTNNIFHLHEILSTLKCTWRQRVLQSQEVVDQQKSNDFTRTFQAELLKDNSVSCSDSWSRYCEGPGTVIGCLWCMEHADWE